MVLLAQKQFLWINQFAFPNCRIGDKSNACFFSTSGAPGCVGELISRKCMDFLEPWACFILRIFFFYFVLCFLFWGERSFREAVCLCVFSVRSLS